jgi:hypothetical protein
MNYRFQNLPGENAHRPPNHSVRRWNHKGHQDKFCPGCYMHVHISLGDPWCCAVNVGFSIFEYQL